MLKLQILLWKSIFLFSKKKKKKNPGNITLNPLQTAPVFTVEFGFTRYKIWFSITLFPKDFKNQAPVTKISDVFDFA